MSVDAEWKGKISQQVNTHGEYHTNHFKSIDKMKIDLTRMQVKIGFFSFVGSLIGSVIVAVVVAWLVKK